MEWAYWTVGGQVALPPLHRSLDTQAGRHFYRTQVSLGSDLWVLMSVRPSVTPRGFADLIDVTLADEDSNSIPTDDVNGQSQAMWQCKWRHLVANIETNAS